MMTTVKSTLARVQNTLLQDLIGGAALLVILLVSLHLPSPI